MRKLRKLRRTFLIWRSAETLNAVARVDAAAAAVIANYSNFRMNNVLRAQELSPHMNTAPSLFRADIRSEDSITAPRGPTLPFVHPPVTAMFQQSLDFHDMRFGRECR